MMNFEWGHTIEKAIPFLIQHRNSNKKRILNESKAHSKLKIQHSIIQH